MDNQHKQKNQLIFSLIKSMSPYTMNSSRKAILKKLKQYNHNPQQSQQILSQQINKKLFINDPSISSKVFNIKINKGVIQRKTNKKVSFPETQKKQKNINEQYQSCHLQSQRLKNQNRQIHISISLLRSTTFAQFKIPQTQKIEIKRNLKDKDMLTSRLSYNTTVSRYEPSIKEYSTQRSIRKNQQLKLSTAMQTIEQPLIKDKVYPFNSNNTPSRSSSQQLLKYNSNSERESPKIITKVQKQKLNLELQIFKRKLDLKIRNTRINPH